MCWRTELLIRETFTGWRNELSGTSYSSAKGNEKSHRDGIAPCSNTGWGGCPESSFAEEDLGVLVNNRLKVSTPEIHSNLNYSVSFYDSRGGIQ